MLRVLAGFLILAAWLGAAATALAQDWPARPVKIIIPLGPGGGGDVFTRLIAEELQKRLGQPFIVENRPGGGLNIGTRACAEAAPDGYTFCVLSGEPVVYNQFTFKNLPFNPEKDFEPVVESVHQRQRAGGQFPLNVKTIPELVALAKTKPGTLSYGTFSFMLVYFMDQLNKKNGIDIVRVPFRSGNEMVNAVMANTTPIVFLGLANMIGQIKSGQFTGACAQFQRALAAVSRHSDARWKRPARTIRRPGSACSRRPARRCRSWTSCTTRSCGSPACPAWRQRNFIDRAVEPATGPRDEFIKFIDNNRAFAARVAKETGMQPQ